MGERFTDINELCKILGCSSRTLRFYEQKGIIESTVEPFHNRRKYSEEQIEHIKKVFVLRSLGLPVAKIKELQSNDKKLSDIIAERKSELIALMTTKSREYNLLCEALVTVEEGGDIFSRSTYKLKQNDYKRLSIAEQFTDHFINGFYDWCFENFSDMLKEYLPLSAFKRVIADTLKPLGKFLKKVKTEKDQALNNVFYSYLKYEKLGLYLKFVFAEDKIHGIWMNYYDYGED